MHRLLPSRDVCWELFQFTDLKTFRNLRQVCSSLNFLWERRQNHLPENKQHGEQQPIVFVNGHVVLHMFDEYMEDEALLSSSMFATKQTLLKFSSDAFVVIARPIGISMNPLLVAPEF